MKGRKLGIQIVGGLSIVVAVIGIIYTVMYFYFVFEKAYDPELPYFKISYYSMVTICMIFYLILIYCGFVFLMLKTEFRKLFLILLLLEVLYFFSLSFFWASSNESIAISVAAATGVANGGLMIQFITLFPLWAPIVVFWGHRGLEVNENTF